MAARRGSSRNRRARPSGETRRTLGGEATVVGRRPALEAVRSGRAVEVLVSEDARSTSALREVAEAAGATDVPVRVVPADRIEHLAEGALHQGVAARVRMLPPLTEADLGGRPWGPDAIVVAVDGVTDPHNLGAIARTTEAAGGEALVLPRRRAAPIVSVAIKASAGALVHLPVAEVANLPRALRRLQEAGFWVIGLDGSAESTIFDDEPSGRLVLVLGSEGTGLSRLVRETCDELRAIPLRGSVGSLNVSVAAGVALFRYAGKGERRG